MFVRTRRKGSEFKDDRYHFTNKWTEVKDGRDYSAQDNLECVEETKKKEDGE
jgi:hypothetical protein